MNACAHRGTCVAHGEGKAQRFKCSYHAWCYDPKGNLVARPGPEHFEGYHFPFLHKESLHPIALGNASFDLYEPHARWAFPLRSIDPLRDLPEDQWPDCFEGTVLYFLFPSCVLAEGSTAAQMIRIYPGDRPGQAQLQFSDLLTGPAGEERARPAYQASRRHK